MALLVAICLPCLYALLARPLERAERRARRGQEELTHLARVGTVGQMAAGLVHELSQPLATIDLAVGECLPKLSDDDADLDDIHTAFEDVATHTRRAIAIVRHITDFVRGREPARTDVRINDLVSETVRFVGAQARQQGITIQIEPGPRLASVYVDRIQIEQVLVNLLQNAMEAVRDADAGQRIVTVRTRPSATDGVEVAVTDSGPGPHADVVERIFEPFFTTKPDGMGMGLHISRSIIEAHGGHLSAAFDRDDGTTFRFTLPA